MRLISWVGQAGSNADKNPTGLRTADPSDSLSDQVPEKVLHFSPSDLRARELQKLSEICTLYKLGSQFPFCSS